LNSHAYPKSANVISKPYGSNDLKRFLLISAVVCTILVVINQESHVVPGSTRQPLCAAAEGVLNYIVRSCVAASVRLW
jgi:hypothetical protein